MAHMTKLSGPDLTLGVSISDLSDEVPLLGLIILEIHVAHTTGFAIDREDSTCQWKVRYLVVDPNGWVGEHGVLIPPSAVLSLDSNDLIGHGAVSRRVSATRNPRSHAESFRLYRPHVVSMFVMHFRNRFSEVR